MTEQPAAERAEKPATPAAEANQPASTPLVDDDALSLCLAAFVGLTDRPTSAASLIAGLPLKAGRLTPELMHRALGRIGYSAQLARRKLSQISAVSLPAILFMGENDACIVTARHGNDLEILDPATGTRHVFSRAELEPDFKGLCLFARRRTIGASEAPDALRDTGGHWFWSVVRKLWPTYGLVIAGSAMINIIALISPLFIMNVYDRVLPNKAIPTLWVLAIGMAAAIAFDFILKSLRSWLIDGAGQRADILLASRIYAHVLAIKMSQKPRTTGAFASQLRDFESVREFFTSGTIATAADMMFFFLFLTVIYYVGGILVVVPAAAAVLLIIAGLIYRIPLRKAANEHAAETAQRHSLLVETVAGIETIKAIKAESQLQRIWEGLVGVTSRTTQRVRALNASLGNLSSFITQMVTVGVVVLGVYQFQEGLLSQGAIVATVMLATRAISPLGQFAMLLARSQQSLTSLRALQTIMGMPTERSSSQTFISAPISNVQVQFQNTVFSYPGAPAPALNGINLAIKPGEKVGIIGKIGSGKTTIGRLLMKLYEPQEGAILIGGVDMRQYHPHEVRRVVGLLGQDTELFFGTIRSNILLANPKASDDQLIEAARQAGVDDFVRRHPLGYEMPVGERGLALSGGQRQSVALARLLIAQPQVIFLDEPSSAMDLASERLLIEQLRRSLKPDQTVIVSTHRYSMLDLVDRLIVINNGKIAADGPKDAVMNHLRNQLPAAKP